MRARDNPFASDRIRQIRYRPQAGSWDDLLERLAQMNYRAALVGPEGTGKTTLLEDLGDRLASCGFTPRPLRLDEEQPEFEPDFLDEFFAAVTPRDLVMLDGAEQMGRLAWFRFYHRARAAGGLVITSHRPGRLPTLLECATTPALLREIVTDLLGSKRAAAAPDLCELHRRHAGNLRHALRELYDVYAERPAGAFTAGLV